MKPTSDVASKNTFASLWMAASLTSLPDEVLMKIMQSLSFTDLFHLRQATRHLRALCDSEPVLTVLVSALLTVPGMVPTKEITQEHLARFSPTRFIAFGIKAEHALAARHAAWAKLQ
jgi:hypothetical protein